MWQAGGKEKQSSFDFKVQIVPTGAGFQGETLETAHWQKKPLSSGLSRQHSASMWNTRNMITSALLSEESVFCFNKVSSSDLKTAIYPSQIYVCQTLHNSPVEIKSSMETGGTQLPLAAPRHQRLTARRCRPTIGSSWLNWELLVWLECPWMGGQGWLDLTQQEVCWLHQAATYAGVRSFKSWSSQLLKKP